MRHSHCPPLSFPTAAGAASAKQTGVTGLIPGSKGKV